jgi:hypothetical protein
MILPASNFGDQAVSRLLLSSELLRTRRLFPASGEGWSSRRILGKFEAIESA